MSPEKHGAVMYVRRQFNELDAGEKVSFPTEYELAWMLGVICGNGFTGKEYNRRLFLTRFDEPELLEEFQNIGRRLFGREPKVKSNRVSFFGKQFISELGDLRNNTWPETIKLKYSFILNDPKHTWKFIEGLFDAKGNIQTKPEDDKALYFRTNNLVSAEFIKKLFLYVGLMKPTIHFTRIKEQAFYKIGVYNIPDLKVIADNIHPKSPEKQNKLKAIKEMPHPVTPVELHNEWARLSKLLQHSPSSYEIGKLYRYGVTKFPRSVYARVFGQESFARAREVLDGQEQIRMSQIMTLASPSLMGAQKLIAFLNSKSRQLSNYGISEDEISNHSAQIKDACDRILEASDEKVNQTIEKLNLLLSRIQRKISTMTPLSIKL